MLLLVSPPSSFPKNVPLPRLFHFAHFFNSFFNSQKTPTEPPLRRRRCRGARLEGRRSLPLRPRAQAEELESAKKRPSGQEVLLTPLEEESSRRCGQGRREPRGTPRPREERPSDREKAQGGKEQGGAGAEGARGQAREGRGREGGEAEQQQQWQRQASLAIREQRSKEGGEEGERKKEEEEEEEKEEDQRRTADPDR